MSFTALVPEVVVLFRYNLFSFIATRRLNCVTYIVSKNAMLRTCFLAFIYTMYNHRSVLAINVPNPLMTSGLVETHTGFCASASLACNTVCMFRLQPTCINTYSTHSSIPQYMITKSCNHNTFMWQTF